jgi:hypothetical protein
VHHVEVKAAYVTDATYPASARYHIVSDFHLNCNPADDAWWVSVAILDPDH